MTLELRESDECDSIAPGAGAVRVKILGGKDPEIVGDADRTGEKDRCAVLIVTGDRDHEAGVNGRTRTDEGDLRCQVELEEDHRGSSSDSEVLIGGEASQGEAVDGNVNGGGLAAVDVVQVEVGSGQEPCENGVLRNNENSELGIGSADVSGAVNVTGCKCAESVDLVEETTSLELANGNVPHEEEESTEVPADVVEEDSGIDVKVFVADGGDCEYEVVILESSTDNKGDWNSLAFGVDEEAVGCVELADSCRGASSSPSRVNDVDAICLESFSVEVPDFSDNLSDDVELQEQGDVLAGEVEGGDSESLEEEAIVVSEARDDIEDRGHDGPQFENRAEFNLVDIEAATSCDVKSDYVEVEMDGSLAEVDESQISIRKQECADESVVLKSFGGCTQNVEACHHDQMEHELLEENVVGPANLDISRSEDVVKIPVTKEEEISHGKEECREETDLPGSSGNSIAGVEVCHDVHKGIDLLAKYENGPVSWDEFQSDDGAGKSVTAEKRIFFGKETCTHDAVSPEICEESACDMGACHEVKMEIELKEGGTAEPETCGVLTCTTEVCSNVPREIHLPEETVTGPMNQEKSLSDGEEEKLVIKEDNAVQGMLENDVVAPAVEEPVSLGFDNRVYLVRIPKMQDESLSAQILHAEACVSDRTRDRDSIRIKMKETMTAFEEHKKNINDARIEERTAREAFYSKQKEMNVIHSTVDKIEIANSIDDFDDRMQYLTHRMQHETISLKEEKQLMREIKELKQKRDHLSKLTPETEIQKAFEQKDQIEVDLKSLRPELERLRKELLQYETKTKAAKKKYDDEFEIMEDLRRQYKVADDLRQESYTQMKDLRKQLYKKNKYFYQYKDDLRAASNYFLSGNKETLRNHCNSQIDRFMELWNRNDEFRNEYVKANLNSIIRRFRTLDGRSLGPDERPATFPSVTFRKSGTSGPDLLALTESPAADSVLPEKSRQDESGKAVTPETDSETSNIVGSGVGNNDRARKLSNKDTRSVIALPNSDKELKAGQEERERQRIADAELKRLADEMARKEQLRQEQEATELREKIRLEQIAKAREAEERKKRKAEKAKVAAEIRASKEAEIKEKKRAKKKRQKEKKAADATDATDGAPTGCELVSDAPQEAIEAPDTSVSPGVKKASRSLKTVKQQLKIIKPLPQPLRNKNKRKSTMWLWLLIGIAIVSVMVLFWISMSRSRTTTPPFGF